MASDNSKLKTQNSKLIQSAFTLVELMIVVAILGILAAVAFPEFQGHIQKAKEAAAKDNLRILREAIERYATDHNGIPPGYPNDNNQFIPNYNTMVSQLVGSNLYLQSIPENPFNDKNRVHLLSNNTNMSANPILPTLMGWIYHPATKTIKLNWSGIDSEGKKYFDY